MKKDYYVIRKFRNGRAIGGYDTGPTNRFATLAEAEQNAADFANDVLPVCPSDRIVVGVGAIRNGFPVGNGWTITEWTVPGRTVGTRPVREENPYRS